MILVAHLYIFFHPDGKFAGSCCDYSLWLIAGFLAHFIYFFILVVSLWAAVSFALVNSGFCWWFVSFMWQLPVQFLESFALVKLIVVISW